MRSISNGLNTAHGREISPQREEILLVKTVLSDPENVTI